VFVAPSGTVEGDAAATTAPPRRVPPRNLHGDGGDGLPRRRRLCGFAYAWAASQPPPLILLSSPPLDQRATRHPDRDSDGGWRRARATTASTPRARARNPCATA